MKRLFLSMMAMAAITTTLTLTSCGSDDDGNDTSDGASILAADGKTLMGAWECRVHSKHYINRILSIKR